MNDTDSSIAKTKNNKNSEKKRKKRLNHIKDTFVAAFIVIFMAYIISYPENSVNFVIKALNLCYLVIIPAIFPFLIISRLFFESPMFAFIGKLLNKPARFLFDIRGEYTNAFLLGSIAGFPIGAKSVKDIYFANRFTKSEAERTLAFCNNCSAPFVISAAGVAVFGSAGMGMLLFATQFISALITGIIIRFIFKSKTSSHVFNASVSNISNEYIKSAKTKKEEKEKPQGLPSAIAESVDGMLNICGIIIFFSVVINMLLHLVESISASSVSAQLGDALRIAVSGILEISSGVYSLVNINLPVSQKLIFISAILAWSGLSVHFQIIYVLKDTGLSLKPYFTGKIIHVIISSVIIKILFGFNGIAKMCQSVYSPIAIMNEQGSYTASLIVTAIVTGITAVIAILVALGFWIYDRANKNTC